MVLGQGDGPTTLAGSDLRRNYAVNSTGLKTMEQPHPCFGRTQNCPIQYTFQIRPYELRLVNTFCNRRYLYLAWLLPCSLQTEPFQKYLHDLLKVNWERSLRLAQVGIMQNFPCYQQPINKLTWIGGLKTVSNNKQHQSSYSDSNRGDV